MITSTIKKSKAIRTNFDGYMYLQRRSRLERVGHLWSEKYQVKLERNYERIYGKSGFIVMDGDYGGATGDPEHSWEEGRWTHWTAKQVADMLTEAGIWWEPAPDQECVVIGI